MASDTRLVKVECCGTRIVRSTGGSQKDSTINVPLSCAAVLGIRSRAIRKTIEFKMTAILPWAGAMDSTATNCFQVGPVRTGIFS